MMCRNRLLISCLLAAATAGFFAGQPGPFSAPGPKGVYVTFGLRVGQAQNAGRSGAECGVSRAECDVYSAPLSQSGRGSCTKSPVTDGAGHMNPMTFQSIPETAAAQILVIADPTLSFWQLF